MGGGKRPSWRDVHVHSPASAIDHGVGEQLKVLSSICVHIVDDDEAVRESLGDVLRSMDYQVMLHGSASEFLNAELPDASACLVLDVRMPGTGGLELQDYLTRINVPMPVILMTGFGDIPMSVKGMKAGAIDFLTKPIRHQDLIDAVATAVRIDQDRRQSLTQITLLRERYALLTPRERQVMVLVASGFMNKQVASELLISEATVKMHRGSVMRKMKAKSVTSLARMAEVLNIER